MIAGFPTQSFHIFHQFNQSIRQGTSPKEAKIEAKQQIMISYTKMRIEYMKICLQIARQHKTAYHLEDLLCIQANMWNGNAITQYESNSIQKRRIKKKIEKKRSL